MGIQTALRGRGQHFIHLQSEHQAKHNFLSRKYNELVKNIQNQNYTNAQLLPLSVTGIHNIITWPWTSRWCERHLIWFAKSDVAGNFSAGWKAAWGGCDLLFPVVSRGLGMLPCVWPHWGRLQSIRAGGKKTRCLPACNQNGYTPITGLCGILQFLLLSEKPPFLLSLFKNANENVTDFSQLWRAEAAGCAVVHGWGRQRGETVAHFQKQGVKSMG